LIRLTTVDENDYYLYRNYRSCGCLPLSDAINNHAPDAIITSLLLLNQEAAEVFDRTGFLPLHMALEKNHSDHVIQALMAANKKALWLSTDTGFLPLHLAFQQNYYCSS
jgi:ankyrin repeat protein